MPIEGPQLPEDKKEGITRIIEESELRAKGYRVDDVAWLKSRDKPLGVSISMGIWFEGRGIDYPQRTGIRTALHRECGSVSG